MQLDVYRREVAKHPVLIHPLVVQFSLGKLTPEQVRVWFIQQYFFSLSLAPAILALYSRLPYATPLRSHPLLELAGLETWGGNDKDAIRVRAFKRLAILASVDISHIQSANEKAYTRDYLGARLQCCRTDILHEAVVAMAMAHYAETSIFVALKDGIRQSLGVRRCEGDYLASRQASDQRAFEAAYETVAPRNGHAVIVAHIWLLNQLELWMDALWAEMAQSAR